MAGLNLCKLHVYEIFIDHHLSNVISLFHLGSFVVRSGIMI